MSATVRPRPTRAGQAIPAAARCASAPVRRTLLGIRFDPLTMDQTVQRCVDAATSGHLLRVGVVNAAKVVHMRRDPRLRAAVAGCDLVVADGQAVVWASRLLRAPLPERVAGIDLFRRLLVEADRLGLSVYFLGARQAVLDALLARLRQRIPTLRIAGYHHGYFAGVQAPAIAEMIARSKADLLFLGMPSPAKEHFVAAYGQQTAARVVHGVGGAFDVLAGAVRRAPQTWQRMGCEWLYRALQEPRRLGPRYLSTNTVFVLDVARELMRRKLPHRV